MDHQLPSNTEQLISALQSIEELKGLAPEELRWIADNGTERFVQDGELVFTQGAPPRHLIFVLVGVVLIKRHTSSPVSVLTGRTGRITGKTPFSRIQAWSADGEIKDHPYFIGCQYHPELKSTVENPHPLFVSFVAASKKFNEQKTTSKNSLLQSEMI